MRRLSKRKKKFIVALSGGVDSAVTAALLKKQRHEVSGVFLNLGNWGDEARKKAQKIAKKLKIPLKIIDARKEFKKRVIDYFIAAYRKGLTPNPCVVCNKEMKFWLLFDLMKKYKFDHVATGHYALIKVQPFPSPTSRRGIPQGRTLCEAKDKTKDQSYFLYRLKQENLAKIIFPLGEYKKSEVKKIAKKFKLPSLEEESQDICFIEKDINSFLKKNIRMKSGDIVAADVCQKKKVCRFHHVDKLTQILNMRDKKNILGKHKGLPLYTFGQRKGVAIGGTGPYWVIGKNIRKNELIVTNDPKKLLTEEFRVSEVNWVNQKVKLPLRAQVQIRYRAEKVSAIIKPSAKGLFSVELGKPLRAVTAGQSAVFYKGEKVLGGGIIA